ncbi:PDZ domain-containing protein [Spartinivicinus ruber]|uniref:PDZ domain-containing protein n=1 Tax=Spartinivicinus ruber TaxID=2683272 RepID=UPI0013D7AD01|nr:PDZ domain-containing protein [Spartinivicinus ruber]
MPNSVVLLLSGAFIGVGIGVGTLTLTSSPEQKTPAHTVSASQRPPTTIPLATAPVVETHDLARLEQRVGTLERDLAQSLSMQQELTKLLEEVLQAQMPGSDRLTSQGMLSKSDAESAKDGLTPKSSRSKKREQLEKAGFDPKTIQRINEIRMKQLQSYYEAIRNPGTKQSRTSFSEAVRKELGDTTYDRYLYATGESNRVRISEVYETSPSEKAGLKAGDIILSYDDERIFTTSDLYRQLRKGEAGESIPVRVRHKNGNESTIYLPRGPFGFKGEKDISENPDAPLTPQP